MRVLKTLAIGGLALVALAATIGFGARLDGASRWAHSLSRIAVLEAHLSVAEARPALRGETQRGDGWPHYVAALSALPDDAHARWIAWREMPDPASRDALIDACANALDSLGRGARSARIGLPPSLARLGSNVLDPVRVRTIVDVALLDATRRLERGDPETAVSRLLDALQFAVDVSRGPFPVDQASGSMAVAVVAEGIAARAARCDAVGLTRFAVALERVDDRLGTSRTPLRGEMIAFAQAHWDAVEGAPDPHAWRFGGSKRWMAADHLEHYASITDELDAIATLPWDRAAPALARLERTRRTSPNPLTRTSRSARISEITVTERTRRSIVAHVRMLRVAIAHLRDGAAPAHVDPFGTTLRCRVDDTAIHVASGRGDEGLTLVVPRGDR